MKFHTHQRAAVSCRTLLRTARPFTPPRRDADGERIRAQLGGECTGDNADSDQRGHDHRSDLCFPPLGGEASERIKPGLLKLQGGSPVALNWCIDSVRKGGNVSVVGAFGPLFSAVTFGDAMNKGLTIRANQCPVKRQWPRLFEHVRNGLSSRTRSSRTAFRSKRLPKAIT